MPDRVLHRWWAHRTSRRFASVGVRIPPARLREMIAGAPLASDESIDVTFAFAATELKREQRAARAKRARRRMTHLLVVSGLILAALNMLVCLGYVIIALALHDSPL
ncbi:hypothetical protein KIH27_16875 [Mycobacterium sp. M1]|uniref:Uncharacterized protein n=1 Tax=Mycolicibacter acidiphilus TaxID=2835306 RepID=A0ABS5RLS3_9MYCO|nr:hypothetical protein [Mycolicibacter acidiphilus]MBS9535263.1 hypothetical protein [Mycolicibacter acidiphilus]